MIDEILPIDMRKMKDINELHTQMCNIVQAMVFNMNKIRNKSQAKNLDREIRSFFGFILILILNPNKTGQISSKALHHNMNNLKKLKYKLWCISFFSQKINCIRKGQRSDTNLPDSSIKPETDVEHAKERRFIICDDFKKERFHLQTNQNNSESVMFERIRTRKMKLSKRKY